MSWQTPNAEDKRVAKPKRERKRKRSVKLKYSTALFLCDDDGRTVARKPLEFCRNPPTSADAPPSLHPISRPFLSRLPCRPSFLYVHHPTTYREREAIRKLPLFFARRSLALEVPVGCRVVDLLAPHSRYWSLERQDPSGQLRQRRQRTARWMRERRRHITGSNLVKALGLCGLASLLECFWDTYYDDVADADAQDNEYAPRDADAQDGPVLTKQSCESSGSNGSSKPDEPAKDAGAQVRSRSLVDGPNSNALDAAAQRSFTDVDLVPVRDDEQNQQRQTQKRECMAWGTYHEVDGVATFLHCWGEDLDIVLYETTSMPVPLDADLLAAARQAWLDLFHEAVDDAVLHDMLRDSPDGIGVERSGREFALEVKSSYGLRDPKPYKTFQWYHVLQCQLHMRTKPSIAHCYLVAWSPRTTKLWKIKRDDTIWQTALPLLVFFHKRGLDRQPPTALLDERRANQLIYLCRKRSAEAEYIGQRPSVYSKLRFDEMAKREALRLGLSPPNLGGSA